MEQEETAITERTYFFFTKKTMNFLSDRQMLFNVPFQAAKTEEENLINLCVDNKMLEIFGDMCCPTCTNEMCVYIPINKTSSAKKFGDSSLVLTTPFKKQKNQQWSNDLIWWRRYTFFHQKLQLGLRNKKNVPTSTKKIGAIYNEIHLSLNQKKCENLTTAVLTFLATCAVRKKNRFHSNLPFIAAQTDPLDFVHLVFWKSYMIASSTFCSTFSFSLFRKAGRSVLSCFSD